MLAELITKGLLPKLYKDHVNNMGLCWFTVSLFYLFSWLLYKFCNYINKLLFCVNEDIFKNSLRILKLDPE